MSSSWWLEEKKFVFLVCLYSEPQLSICFISCFTAALISVRHRERENVQS